MGLLFENEAKVSRKVGGQTTGFMPLQEQCVCLPGEGRDRMKREIRGKDREKLAQEIAGLTVLSVKELKDRWRTLYGTEPHQRISRELLTRAVAYRIQELALGGLKPSTRRLLERIAESASSRQSVPAVPVRKTPRGTVLIREWQGVSHRVTVVDDAVVYREQRYGSLSEVARVITGARWSGPLFFGLKVHAEECRDGAC
jgi:hypothetical protein